MYYKKNYSILLILFFTCSVFGQGDPCEYLLNPNRNGSIVLPDGKSWCDVARETGDSYAECRCKQSKKKMAEKERRQAEIDKMYAQRDDLQEKAELANTNAHEINLSDGSANFEAKKLAKIAYLEEYIGYYEQAINLVKEMNQRYNTRDVTQYMEQDISHAREEINRLKEKQQSKTLSISASSSYEIEADAEDSNDQKSKSQTKTGQDEMSKNEEIMRREAEKMQAYEKAMSEAEAARSQGDFQSSAKALERAKYYNPHGVSDQQLGYARAASYADASMDLIAMGNKSYKEFQRQKKNLSTINSRDINGVYNEYRNKSQDLVTLYENRKLEGAQQVDKAVNSMQNTLAENEAESAMMGLIGEISKASGKKQLEREKQEEIAKLNQEKERRINELVSELKSLVEVQKEKFLQAAKYAISSETEAFYLEHLKYQDCIEKHAITYLMNRDYCEKPNLVGAPDDVYETTGETLFQAYKRKMASSHESLRNFAVTYLNMAIEKSPNNEKYLKEMAYNIAETNEDKLKYFGQLVKINPDNDQYREALDKAIKIDLGRKGAVGKTVNGKRDGLWTFYWLNGDVQSVVNYDKGLIKNQTMQIYFSEVGALYGYSSNIKEDAVVYVEISYDKEGNKIPYTPYFYLNGQLKYEYEYLDEKLKNPDGNFKEYYPNGQLKTEMIYKDGTKFSITKAYDKQGNAKELGNLNDGNGIFVYDNNQTIDEEYFINGIKIFNFAYDKPRDLFSILYLKSKPEKKHKYSGSDYNMIAIGGQKYINSREYKYADITVEEFYPNKFPKIIQQKMVWIKFNLLKNEVIESSKKGLNKKWFFNKNGQLEAIGYFKENGRELKDLRENFTD